MSGMGTRWSMRDVKAMVLPVLVTMAATPGWAADSIALSPQERAAAIEKAAARTDDGIDGGVHGRTIHGEVGIEVGSRGDRALYGTTVVPLGETGTAAFSFSTARVNGWRAR